MNSAATGATIALPLARRRCRRRSRRSRRSRPSMVSRICSPGTGPRARRRSPSRSSAEGLLPAGLRPVGAKCNLDVQVALCFTAGSLCPELDSFAFARISIAATAFESDTKHCQPGNPRPSIVFGHDQCYPRCRQADHGEDEGNIVTHGFTMSDWRRASRCMAMRPSSGGP